MTSTTPHLDLIDQYCQDVRSGKRVVGKLERLAVRRYIIDRAKAKRDDCEFYFDALQAEEACHFFPLMLQHTDGEYAGDPFELKDFQAFVVANLWGFRNKKTGRRRFREAFYSLGRGNGKTPFGAGLALLAFYADTPEPEQRAEVYTFAVKLAQAMIAFDQAKRYVRHNKHLAKRIKVIKRNMYFNATDSKFEPMASDGKSLDGLVTHFVLRDEVHAWTEQFREVYEKIETSLAKRSQPLAITTTTAGNEESQIWFEQYNYAKAVVNPKSPIVDEAFFVFICEIDDDDDETDPEVWAKANPMMAHGVVKRDEIQRLANKAKISPAIKQQLRRYYCNKMAFSANKPITPELWAKGNGNIPEGLEMYTPHAGIDLGWYQDFAGVGWVFPLDLVEIAGDEEDPDDLPQMKRRYWIDCDVFIPSTTKRNLMEEPFATWIARQDERVKITTAGEAVDTNVIYRRIKRRQADHGVRTAAIDKDKAREFMQNLEAMGIETYAFQQSAKKYHEPLNEFMVALAEGRIFHGGNDVLGWFAQNMVRKENAEGLAMPAKALSIDKIDPFVGVIMAFSEAMFAEKERRSIYETRGPIG